MSSNSKEMRVNDGNIVWLAPARIWNRRPKEPEYGRWWIGRAALQRALNRSFVWAVSHPTSKYAIKTWGKTWEVEVQGDTRRIGCCTFNKVQWRAITAWAARQPAKRRKRALRGATRR